MERGGQMKTKDTAKEVQRKIKEVLRDPTQFIDRHGKRLPKDLSYSEATTFVFKENPNLEKSYREFLNSDRLKGEEEEKRRLEAGKEIIRLVKEEMRLDPNLSFSQALTLVQKEHKDLILEYLNLK